MDGEGFQMAGWQVESDISDPDEWDKQLLTFERPSCFQEFQWGIHKEAFGWHSCRLTNRGTDGDVNCMVLALVKRIPLGGAAAWVAGGPVGNVQWWASDLGSALKEAVRATYLYVRVLSSDLYDDAKSQVLLKHDWSRPPMKLRSGLSMELDLTSGLEHLKAGLSKNWRHNLKRVDKNSLFISLWKTPDIDEIYALYHRMESFKGLQEQFSYKQLESLFRDIKDRIVVFKCVDANENLIALRGAYISGHLAWDLFAATADEGRKVYASYALFWHLISYCADHGIVRYDLMGIDPEAAPGVYNFKKGTGAAEIRYLGEWEWASLPLLKPLANLALRKIRV